MYNVSNLTGNSIIVLSFPLLVGTIGGQVWFVANEGSREKPGYGEAKPIVADGNPIRVPGGDAGPCVADWDADGKADLLVGCATGGVFWYRNTGAKGKPELTAGSDSGPPRQDRGPEQSSWGSAHLAHFPYEGLRRRFQRRRAS